MSDSLVNQKLGDYLVEKLLGQGGMARVYRGWDTRANRYVAIKVIDKAFRDDSEYSLRFEREAQAIGKLNHPNIVPLYHYGEAEGELYMAMAYIEGSDLETQLENYRNAGEIIPADDALRLIQQVCSALDYIHAEGTIHRDIKPGNIMLNKEGHAFLTDFGLALMTEIGTRGEIFGSPHYIAPEQAISSAGAVPQSDFYSLGVILYEMFTGQLPFESDSPTDLAMKHMTEPPPPPRELRKDLSPDIENLILKCLAKEPDARYEDGAALAAALETALQSEIQTQPVRGRQSILERVNLEIEKNPLPPVPAIVSAGPPQTVPRQMEPTQSSAPDLWGTPPPVDESPPPTLPRDPEEPGGGMGIWAFAIVIVVGLVIVGALFLLLSGGDEESEDATPTEVSAVQVTSTEGTPPASETESPADTPAPAATSTTGGEDTPSSLPTPTTGPSMTPPSPSETVPPTAVATEEGLLVRFFYNNSSFYIRNASQDVLLVEGLAFERVMDDGTFTNRYDGTRLANLRPKIAVGRCAAIEMNDRPTEEYLIPPACDGYNMYDEPASIDPIIFWTEQSGSRQFRVLWNNEELGRCWITQGQCGVTLPAGEAVAAKPTAAPILAAPTEELPTSTPSEVPPTVTPTQEPPTATITEVPPTVTPTQEPPTSSPTEEPTPVPADGSTPAPTATVLYPDGIPVHFYYNDSSFYIHNLSDGVIKVASFRFERVWNDGNLNNPYDGSILGAIYPDIEPQMCAAVEMTDRDEAEHLNPAECAGYNSINTPASTFATIFWTAKPGSPQFRVLWNDEEIGRCWNSLETCGVFLPVDAESAAPTQAPTEVIVAVPTVLYPDGRRIDLYYNDSSFYIHNASDTAVRVSQLTFERVLASGSFTNEYPGATLGNLYPNIDPDGCGAVEMIDRDSSEHLNPAVCGTYNSINTPRSTFSTIFWTAQSGSSQFRVLWNGAEIARCEIAAGSCEVYVP